MLGAALGKRLRGLDGTFSPRVLGDAKLSQLLSRFPDLGTIELEPTVNDFYFRFRRGATGIQGRGVVERVPGVPWVVPEAWQAFTGVGRLKWVLDFQTQRIQTVLAPGVASSIETTPERFISVQPIPDEQRKADAAAFAEQLPNPIRDSVVAAMAQPVWRSALLQVLRALGREASWHEAERRFVASKVKEWCEAHGIQPERFVREQRPPARPREVRPSRVGGITASTSMDPRALVHAALDRMPEDELLSLAIPLRYLLPVLSGLSKTVVAQPQEQPAEEEEEPPPGPPPPIT